MRLEGSCIVVLEPEAEADEEEEEEEEDAALATGRGGVGNMVGRDRETAAIIMLRVAMQRRARKVAIIGRWAEAVQKRGSRRGGVGS